MIRNKIIMMIGVFSVGLPFMALAATSKQPPLKFGVGKKSDFVMENGDRAHIVGVAGLTAKSFVERESDKMRTFEDARIIDAEKRRDTHVDDYWCEQLTDCNLLVWTGWAKQTIGITNEDDFAEMLLKDPTICKHEILEWTLAKGGYSLDDSSDRLIAWEHAKGSNIERYVSRVVRYFEGADRLAYLQVDWQNRRGSHAVTCCGYATRSGRGVKKMSPESLSGVFIINSDNDKSNGSGGRTAPNTIQFQRVWFDAEKRAYFSEFPYGDVGKMRFICWLRAYDKKLAKAFEKKREGND